MELNNVIPLFDIYSFIFACIHCHCIKHDKKDQQKYVSQMILVDHMHLSDYKYKCFIDTL